VSAELHALRPRLTKDGLTKRLEEYVKVENVAVWSDWYRFADRLRCREVSRPYLARNPNTQAQLFFAYVGAVFEEDHVVARVEEWIKVLLKFQEKHQAIGAGAYFNDITSMFTNADTLVQEHAGKERGSSPDSPQSTRSKTPTDDQPTTALVDDSRFREGTNPISRLNGFKLFRLDGIRRSENEKLGKKEKRKVEPHVYFGPDDAKTAWHVSRDPF